MPRYSSRERLFRQQAKNPPLVNVQASVPAILWLNQSRAAASRIVSRINYIHALPITHGPLVAREQYARTGKPYCKTRLTPNYSLHPCTHAKRLKLRVNPQF